ncbi:MAG TPA: hypothetical protein ENF47_06700 [Thermoprotei archaeon]|nr:hypothetical protein [Thermoprotei archaeon]
MDKPEVVILRLIIVSALAAVSTYLLVIYTLWNGFKAKIILPIIITVPATVIILVWIFMSIEADVFKWESINNLELPISCDPKNFRKIRCSYRTSGIFR